MNGDMENLSNENTGEGQPAGQAADSGAIAPEARGLSIFDWVRERSRCTLPQIFKELMLQVEQDVKTRNDLRPQYANYQFSLTEKGPEFTVHLEAKELRLSVIFSLAEHAILVGDSEGHQMFEVNLTFSESGECKLNVHGKELEMWQVRRLALEDLMFTRN